MSTRGAIGFILNGKPYVTYNHCDSYPEGLGQEMVDFCKKVTQKNKWETFKKNAKKVKLVDQNNPAHKKWQDKYLPQSDFGVGTQKETDWYCVLRGFQGISSLYAVLNERLEHFIDSSNFLKDSLFCEFAYIIDLDKNEVLFFRGFNKSPLSKENNPLNLSNEDSKPLEWDKTQTYYPVYYPVKLVGKCPVDNIPHNWMEEFYIKEEETV